MPRSPTTEDVFNAIGESRRREIIELLSKREQSVNEIVETLEMSQPLVSKHLRVLREVGVVIARREGRTKWYRLKGSKLKPVFDWAKLFESFWDHQLEQVRKRAESHSVSNKPGRSKRSRR